MCLQPSIIINPRFVKMSSYGTYPCVHMPSRDFFYTRNAFDTFDYKTFSAKRNGVNSKNINDFYAFNDSGEVLPLYLEVACGHCAPCIMRKKNDYKNKLILEQSCHDCPPLLLTLTYNDEHLPEDGVSVVDVQLFLKRWRFHIQHNHVVNQRFRYVCHSEYTPTGTRRPHYHFLIFGYPISPRDILRLEDELLPIWGKGFVDVRLCDHGCFNYVSKYVCKGSNVPPGKNPNFRLSSRRGGGLGVPAFNDDTLYFKLLSSPHPLITVKALGRPFQVFVPKSIRERLCRSPRQFLPHRIIKTFKLFCHKCCLLRVLMDDIPEFSSHVVHACSLEGIKAPLDSLIPLPIFDKFAALEICPVNVTVPYYLRNDAVIHTQSRRALLDEYVKLYKILDDFYLDFDKMYHFTYLRGTVYERWKLSLARFVEANPDSDPLSVSKFNAILVEFQRFNHPA